VTSVVHHRTERSSSKREGFAQRSRGRVGQAIGAGALVGYAAAIPDRGIAYDLAAEGRPEVRARPTASRSELEQPIT